MTKRLEYFESGKAQEGLELGIVSDGVFKMFIRYKVYKNYIDAGKNNKEARICAAEELNCDPSLVFKSVRFFKSDDAPGVKNYKWKPYAFVS